MRSGGDLAKTSRIENGAVGMRSCDASSTSRIAPAPTNCSHLRLAPAYEREVREAERRGWPTVNAPLGHLGILTEPGAVVSLLLHVLTACGVFLRRTPFGHGA